MDIYDLKADRWGWYSDKCKAYVTENWGMIAEQIEEGLARDLDKAAKDVVGVATKKRDALQEAIGEVSQNVDWEARKDAVLFNALSLLVDKAYGYEGIVEMFDELGVTSEDLETMGISFEGFVVGRPIAEVLTDAQARSQARNEATVETPSKELFE